MKIKQLHIYGFGKWQEQSWELSEQKITMIAGDNEAGKSTIRAFILYMLFGLPPQQRQRYLPKRGGQLGGRLVVQASDGKDYTIERLHDRFNGEAVCYDDAGQQQEAEWLNQELNGIDRSLYGQIFNFDVFSLQIESGLSEEQLGEVLLSVGMTGSDRIYQTEKQLNKVLDAQFKKQGSKPELNQLINQLVEKDRELKDLEDSVTAYQEHQKQSQTYQAEIKTKRSEIKELTQQLSLYSKQQHIYPAIENYHLLEQQLADFPDSIDFPEQGEARYREAKDTLQPLQADKEVGKRQVSDLEADLAQLKERLLPEQKVSQIRARLDQVDHYQELINEQKQLERQLDEKNQAITSELNELKLNLSEDELVDLPINYTTEQTWQQLAEDFNQTTKDLSEHEQALDSINERSETLESTILDLEAKTLSDREKELAEKELDQLNQWFNQDQEKGADSSKLQSSQRIFSLFSLSVMVISLIFVLITDNNIITAFLLGVIIIVGLIFSWQQFKFNKNWLAQLNDQTKEQTAKGTEYRDQLVKKLTLHDNNRDQLLLARDQFEKHKAEQLHVSERISQLKRGQDMTEQKIEQEHQQFSFLQSLSVSFWPDLVSRLLTVIHLIDERDQLESLLKQTRSNIKVFEVETKNELGDLFGQKEKPFQSQLSHLKEIAIQQQHDLEQKEKIENRLAEQNKVIEQLRAKMIPYQDEITHLLKQADVEEEEQFIALARRYQEWRELTEKKQEMLRQIQLHLPESVTTDVLAGEFLTENELELKVKSIEVEIDELEQELAELIQKEADQQASLKSLAHSKETVDLKHAFHFTEDKLMEKAKEWLVNQIAVEQIAKTKAVFQTSYLPVVLERATGYFTQLTDERYTQIEFDQSNQQLFILAEDQQRYRFEELSQGTLDQLFVSIRLAISSWLAEHIHLPFLIDDGFVHFDANRKQQVFQILEALSESHQIIYFTKDAEIFDQNSHHFINLR